MKAKTLNSVERIHVVMNANASMIYDFIKRFENIFSGNVWVFHVILSTCINLLCAGWIMKLCNGSLNKYRLKNRKRVKMTTKKI